MAGSTPPTRPRPLWLAQAGRLTGLSPMVAGGVLGFVLREMRYPMAPLVLGLVLGDILDKSLRRGLVLSDGSVVPFLTRPISLVLWVTIAITVLLSFRRARTALVRLLPGRASRGEVS